MSTDKEIEPTIQQASLDSPLDHGADGTVQSLKESTSSLEKNGGPSSPRQRCYRFWVSIR